MPATGLLIVSNVRNFKAALTRINICLNKLYIHIHTRGTRSLPSWSNDVAKIYTESLSARPELDVNILISPLKQQDTFKLNKPIDVLFCDNYIPTICKLIQDGYKVPSEPIYLSKDCKVETEGGKDQGVKMYNNVVLGGTFDRLHTGHKILLTEAVLRTCKRLVVGVTDENMIKSKKLWELILPIESRIKDVRNFLLDIDPDIQYEIVPIQDPFGPTKTDPDLDLIIVSAETLRGGQKINEIRRQNGLNPLKIHCIDLVGDNLSESEHMEDKVSSGNTRINLLGTRIRPPQARPLLPPRPYVIGLTGGIASGKSCMSKRLERLGACVIDCDKIAHKIYEPGKTCYTKIVRHFGYSILDIDRKVDRRKLGSIVFENPKELDALNMIVWPELLQEVKRIICEIRKEQRFQVVVIEAAVLLKAGWENECHEVWSMIVSREEAIKRVRVRNNLSEEEAIKRINSQLDNKTIVDRSNVVFSSEWSHSITQEQAEKAWKMLMKELSS